MADFIGKVIRSVSDKIVDADSGRGISLLKRQWRDLVGFELAELTAPYAIHFLSVDGINVLYIKAACSAAGFMMKQKEHAVIDRINSRSHLKIKIGGIIIKY